MKVRILKRFISTAIGGDLSIGNILSTTDAYGKHLIQYGLAEKVEPAADEGIKKGKDEVSVNPTPPTEEKIFGALSQAARVSPKKIAKKFVNGGQKVKKGKLRL